MQRRRGRQGLGGQRGKGKNTEKWGREERFAGGVWAAGQVVLVGVLVFMITCEMLAKLQDIFINVIILTN